MVVVVVVVVAKEGLTKPVVTISMAMTTFISQYSTVSGRRSLMGRSLATSKTITESQTCMPPPPGAFVSKVMVTSGNPAPCSLLCGILNAPGIL